MTADERPTIESMKLTFSQEEDTCGRSGIDRQTIDVEVIRMDDPTVDSHGCYFVISTDRWAVNSSEELAEIIGRLEQAIKAGS